jgi:hypothetical protein
MLTRQKLKDKIVRLGMDNKECAKWLVELYSDYFELAGRYSRPVIVEYSEAVAKAIMLLGERRTHDD